MNKEEYSERMGYKEVCSDAEFKVAKQAYMSSYLGRSEFFEDYKKHKDSLIIAKMTSKIEELSAEMIDLYEKLEYKSGIDEEGVMELLKITKDLYRIGYKAVGDDIAKIIKPIVGTKDIIKAKIENNIHLTKEEKEEVLSKL